MNYYPESFKKYLFKKESKTWFFTALIVGVTYFIALRFIYPIPSYYSDSFTWVGAAKSGQPVTFRPVGYSKLLIFFRFFSTSDIALIAAQYFANLFANLFLFFTCTYLFRFTRVFKWVLFALLIINLFYLFYSNYVSSDAFFCCLAVLWFTLLIWILHKPSWLLIIAQLVVLASLFEIRYNAIFFPAISAFAIMLSRQSITKKMVSIIINIVAIAAIVIATTIITKNYTGTKTFSAFSGWQLANDALHIIQHEKIDTASIQDPEVKKLVTYTSNFLDTTTSNFPDTGASAVFMWHINSPLKRYMKVYDSTSKSYFKTWNALGPVYNNFGKTVILKKPGSYLKHFVFPNLQAVIFPPLEIYETYMEDHDTIAAVAQKYYRYKSKKTPQHYPALYSVVFKPVVYMFLAMNIIFIIFGIDYFLSGRYKKHSVLFTQTLLCFAAFYLANFLFIVLLAPSVFRYHVFILTLSFPILLYMVQQLTTASPETISEGSNAG